MAIQKSEVLALVDNLRAGVDALPDVDLGGQIAALEAQVLDLQSRVSALEAKIASAIQTLQA